MSLWRVISGSTEPILKILLPIESHVICECHRLYNITLRHMGAEQYQSGFHFYQQSPKTARMFSYLDEVDVFSSTTLRKHQNKFTRPINNNNNTSLLFSHCGKGLFSYREGTSIDRHVCSRRIGDFRLILIIISTGFLTMFSFTDVNDVQDKLRKYIWIEKVTLVLDIGPSRH